MRVQRFTKNAKSQNKGTIFCDEAGFTGNDLLDQEQEVFALAGTAMSQEQATDIVERTLRDFRLQGKELKGSRLLGTDRGRKAVTCILKECAPYTKLVCHLKKFALACKFFEYIFEPALADQNSVFYNAGFHLFIGNLLYMHLLVRPDSAETIFQEFSKLMRQGDQEALQNLFPKTGIIESTSNPLTAISLFAMLNREAIIDELNVVHGDGSVPNWVLDLTTTSLSSVLSYWGEQYDALDVFCDRSKPLETETDFFEAMVGRTDHFRVRWLGKDRQYTFNLIRLPQLVDSKLCHGVQIADVMASSVARAYRSNYRHTLGKDEKLWLGITKECLLDDNIWPDLESIDLDKRSGFVNSALLLELTNRSVKKQDLFAGIPEFIAAAHHIFPEFKIRNRN